VCVQIGICQKEIDGESVKKCVLVSKSGIAEEYDTEKADEMALALLFLTSFEDHGGVRAWKGKDWDIMNRLHEKGLISDPKSKAKSVCLTDEGAKLSRALFEKYLSRKS
jgi:hypothetical protein